MAKKTSENCHLPILTQRRNWRLILGMYLITSATKLEIAPIRQHKELAKRCAFLVTGIGPVEAAISLTRFLSESDANSASASSLDGIIAFGVCGAYPESDAKMLDVCIAENEYMGDLGVAFDNQIEYFAENIFEDRTRFDLRNPLTENVIRILADLDISYKQGNFVTVNSCTGTLARGAFLRDHFNAICENMEGAALARVCSVYSIPFVELRCISNIVEDRDKSKWKVGEAISKGNEVLTKLLAELTTEVNK